MSLMKGALQQSQRALQNSIDSGILLFFRIPIDSCHSTRFCRIDILYNTTERKPCAYYLYEPIVRLAGVKKTSS